MAVTLTLLALLIEAMAGYPDRLVRSIGHPVIWMGGLIAGLERRWNRETMAPALRRRFGTVAVVLLVGIVAVAAFIIERGLLILPFGLIGVGVIASTLIAQRSLHQHVARVADALDNVGLASGREAVSHIVSRDTKALDEAGVARAAIESLAENFSDGVVAPVLWMIIAGLPGAAIYKAVNTADSMIGHRTARFQAFGWAAARFDDLLNLPASRLSALLIIAAAAATKGTSASAAWRAVRRDARHHRSPNAGYPEAAIAGALGLALAGPRSYAGVHVDDAFMGNGRHAAKTNDIRAALRLYRRADAILIGLVAMLAAALIATD
ncbi:MAG TPA: adenosylcobinamide-phosphate synthase CbiB [Xanthobacteraceae bacterium]|jgi:adenosylcobinamide-phosphate synthase|nr:adenosylcobinamide-phosphate synthase CbiB [Xanthobacteraceae bacterium]